MLLLVLLMQLFLSSNNNNIIISSNILMETCVFLPLTPSLHMDWYIIGKTRALGFSRISFNGKGCFS